MSWEKKKNKWDGEKKETRKKKKNFEEQWSGDYSIGKQSGLWWDKATGAGIIIFIIIIISSSSSSSIVLYETEIVQQEMGQDETIGSEAIASAYIWLLILMPRCRYMLRWTCNSIWREGGGPLGASGPLVVVAWRAPRALALRNSLLRYKKPQVLEAWCPRWR